MSGNINGKFLKANLLPSSMLKKIGEKPEKKKDEAKPEVQDEKKAPEKQEILKQKFDADAFELIADRNKATMGIHLERVLTPESKSVQDSQTEGSSGEISLDEDQAQVNGDTQYAKGDVNHDGVVDVADISAVINAMSEDGTNTQYDVNGDGSVDIADISAVSTIMAGNDAIDDASSIDESELETNGFSDEEIDAIAEMLKDTVPNISSEDVKAMIDDITAMAESKGVNEADKLDYVSTRLVDFLAMRAENPDMTVDEMNERKAINDMSNLMLENINDIYGNAYGAEITSIEDLLEWQNFAIIDCETNPDLRSAYLNSRNIIYMQLAQNGELDSEKYYEYIANDLANLFPNSFYMTEDEFNNLLYEQIGKLSPDQILELTNKTLDLPAKSDPEYKAKYDEFMAEFNSAVENSTFDFSKELDYTKLMDINQISSSRMEMEFDADEMIIAMDKIKEIKDLEAEATLDMIVDGITEQLELGNITLEDALWQYGFISTGSAIPADIEAFLKDFTGKDNIRVEGGTVIIDKPAGSRGFRVAGNGSSSDKQIMWEDVLAQRAKRSRNAREKLDNMIGTPLDNFITSHIPDNTLGDVVRFVYETVKDDFKNWDYCQQRSGENPGYQAVMYQQDIMKCLDNHKDEIVNGTYSYEDAKLEVDMEYAGNTAYATLNMGMPVGFGTASKIVKKIGGTVVGETVGEFIGNLTSKVIKKSINIFAGKVDIIPWEIGLSFAHKVDCILDGLKNWRAPSESDLIEAIVKDINFNLRYDEAYYALRYAFAKKGYTVIESKTYQNAAGEKLQSLIVELKDGTMMVIEGGTAQLGTEGGGCFAAKILTGEELERFLAKNAKDTFGSSFTKIGLFAISAFIALFKPNSANAQGLGGYDDGSLEATQKLFNDIADFIANNADDPTSQALIGYMNAWLNNPNDINNWNDFIKAYSEFNPNQVIVVPGGHAWQNGQEYNSLYEWSQKTGCTAAKHDASGTLINATDGSLIGSDGNFINMLELPNIEILGKNLLKNGYVDKNGREWNNFADSIDARQQGYTDPIAYYDENPLGYQGLNEYREDFVYTYTDFQTKRIVDLLDSNSKLYEQYPELADIAAVLNMQGYIPVEMINDLSYDASVIYHRIANAARREEILNDIDHEFNGFTLINGGGIQIKNVLNSIVASGIATEQMVTDYLTELLSLKAGTGCALSSAEISEMLNKYCNRQDVLQHFVGEVTDLLHKQQAQLDDLRNELNRQSNGDSDKILKLWDQIQETKSNMNNSMKYILRESYNSFLQNTLFPALANAGLGSWEKIDGQDVFVVDEGYWNKAGIMSFEQIQSQCLDAAMYDLDCGCDMIQAMNRMWDRMEIMQKFAESSGQYASEDAFIEAYNAYQEELANVRNYDFLSDNYLNDFRINPNFVDPDYDPNYALSPDAYLQQLMNTPHCKADEIGFYLDYQGYVQGYNQIHGTNYSSSYISLGTHIATTNEDYFTMRSELETEYQILQTSYYTALMEQGANAEDTLNALSKLQDFSKEWYQI